MFLKAMFRPLFVAAACLSLAACGVEPVATDPGENVDASDGGDGGNPDVDSGNAEPIACGNSENECPEGQFCLYAKESACGASGTGVCTRKPETCVDEDRQQCGCDAVTYDNECAAHQAGVSVASEGACRDPACGPQLAAGSGDGAAVWGFAFDGSECVEIAGDSCEGDDCDALFSEKMACFTHFHGLGCIVGVPCGGAFDAECGPDDFCAFPAAHACGDNDQSGVCTPRPDPNLCDPRVGGVQCACNGETFTNGCLARLNGHDVDYPGPCAVVECRAQVAMGDGHSSKSLGFRFDGYKCVRVEGETCEGADCGSLFATRAQCFNHYLSRHCFVPDACDAETSSCSDEEYCAFESTNTCGAFGPGVCRPKPLFCMTVGEQVCGCDGQVYSNRCEASNAGADVRHPGKCSACAPMDVTEVGDCSTERYQWTGSACVPFRGCECDGAQCDKLFDDKETCLAAYSSLGCAVICGGRLGATCADDEFCRYTEEAACGRTDATGVCMPRPTECPPGRMPHCGCDGETYASECAAWMDGGVSVLHLGMCEVLDNE